MLLITDLGLSTSFSMIIFFFFSEQTKGTCPEVEVLLLTTPSGLKDEAAACWSQATLGQKHLP